MKSKVYYGIRHIGMVPDDCPCKKALRKINVEYDSDQKFNLIIMGPPGSGKGTQINFLIKEGYKNISTSKLLKKESNIEIKKNMEKGNLVPDDIVLNLIEKELLKFKSERGFILDGFPRTLNQAKKLDKILDDKTIDAVIEINTSTNKIIKRVSGRYIFNNCGTTFNKNFNNPKKKGVCDVCGSKKFKTRKDDNPDIVKKRLKIYQKESKNIVKYYKNKGIYFQVDGDLEASITNQQIKRILKELS